MRSARSTTCCKVATSWCARRRRRASIPDEMGGARPDRWPRRARPAGGWRVRLSLEALCWARAQPVYLGENEGLCRILGRYKLCVDTRDQGLCTHLLLDGFWEMGLTMYIARHVRDGMVAIDIGANFGYYTILLAALVGERGHVYAIEPAPATAVMLRRSVQLNGFDSFTTVIE